MVQNGRLNRVKFTIQADPYVVILARLSQCTVFSNSLGGGVIVCDDGSSPQVFEQCHAVAQAASMEVQWVWQQDRGHRKTRNLNNALRLARGEWLLLLDGDMLPESDLLQRHLAAHEGGERVVTGERAWRDISALEMLPGASVTDILDIMRGDSAISADSRTTQFIENFLRRQLLQSDCPWHAGFGCNMSVRRVHACEFDEQFRGWGLEDAEWTCHAMHKHGLQIHHESSAVAYHLDDTASNPWMSNDHEAIVSHLRNLCYFRDKWPDGFGAQPPMILMPYELDEENDRWVGIKSLLDIREGRCPRNRLGR